MVVAVEFEAIPAKNKQTTATKKPSPKTQGKHNSLWKPGGHACHGALTQSTGQDGKSPPPLSHERERERNKSCMNNWKCRLPILDIPVSGFIPLIQNPRLQSANTTNCLLNSKALETKTLLAHAFCYRRLTSFFFQPGSHPAWKHRCGRSTTEEHGRDFLTSLKFFDFYSFMEIYHSGSSSLQTELIFFQKFTYKLSEPRTYFCVNNSILLVPSQACS